MTSQEYDLLYNAEQKHWWFVSRRKIISHLFWNTYHANKNMKILSVGSGTGAELDYLSQYGQTTGIDIDPVAIQYCTRRGYQVLKEDITRSSFPNDLYDVIFAMDVLEHIPEHEKAYAEICRILKKGGYFVMTVPACQFLWSKFDELLDSPHQRRYSKKTLQDLLQRKDMEIQKISYFNFFLFPLIFLIRKLNIGAATQLKVPGKKFNTMLQGIFSFERHFLRCMGLPIGSSLIAICKKK